jgi:hypothetical protein
LPAEVWSSDAAEGPYPPIKLGPWGPFPDASLVRVLERRWLHYAFLARDDSWAMVANISWLGRGRSLPGATPRNMAILLVHREGGGWESSQFNASIRVPLWSAFRQPAYLGSALPFAMASSAGSPRVDLSLTRTSHPCTSQCSTFGPGHHFRWQSETGIVARGRSVWRGGLLPEIDAVGYHERVRGYWGWPEMGGCVFGFANDPEAAAGAAPRTAIAFTLIQPVQPPGAATGSLMLWREGRLHRHFPRRNVSVAVGGLLDRDSVRQVPNLACLLGVPPAPPVPASLVVMGRLGADWLVFDFQCESAARIVIPSETGFPPYSVHEVIGACRIEGRLNRVPLRFDSRAIVEFAGGAYEG